MGYYSIPMTKGLPYEIFMRQIIVELTQRDQLHQLQKKWESPKPNCGPSHRSGNPLSWQKLLSVFIIAIIGTSMALVILIIEKMYHHKYQKNINSDCTKCLSVKEINKIKLQGTLKKIDCSLNNDRIIGCSTMKSLYQEMEKYDFILKDSKLEDFP